MYLTAVFLGCCLLGQDAGKPFSPFVVLPDVPAMLPEAAGPELEAALPILGHGDLASQNGPTLTETQHIEEIGDVPAVAAPVTSSLPAAEWPATGSPIAEMPIAEMPIAEMPAAEMPDSMPFESVRQRATPPERVDVALTLPSDSRLSGRMVSLDAVLASVASRPQQLEVLHAYWRLADAVGRYHFALQHDAWLKQLPAPVQDRTTWQAALAASAAQWQEAEVAAVAVQYELADLVRLPSDSPLPLPADRPHVGPYRTRFDELFSTHAAPVRARLMERTLPIRWRAIEDRAGAVGMSEDALAAALADYQAGLARVPEVLQCLDRCTAHRQALMASVCRYNADIADYALAVAGPTVGGPALVSMLIQPSPHSVQPLFPRRDPDVQRTGLERSIRTPRSPQRAVPTPAMRPDDAGAGPSTTGPSTTGRTTDESPWVPSGSSLLDKANSVEPSADERGGSAIFHEIQPGEPAQLPWQPKAKAVPTTPELPMVPVESPVEVPVEPVTPTTLHKPVVEVVS